MAITLDVSIDDLILSYEGTIEKGQVSWVETKIEEASRELLSYPGVKQAISSGRVDALLVRDKVIAAVLRVVRNPLGIDTEGEGDYNIRLRPTVASGDVWFLEKDLLQVGWTGKLDKSKPRTVFSTPSRGFGFPGGMHL